MVLNSLANGVIAFAFPGLPKLHCVFTTRLNGSLSLSSLPEAAPEREECLQARQKLLSLLGIKEWSEMQQVHGDNMLIDPPVTQDSEALPQADGQATGRKQHALCVKTADCQPILLAHPSGAVAAVHAGWRGNVLRFPQTAVSSFCEAYSLDPCDLRAVRGPSLGLAEFVNFEREWPEEFAPWFNPQSRRVDLWGLTRKQLGDAGLKAENIFGLDLCTLSLPGMFFSHRRGDSGRQMGIIWSE